MARRKASRSPRLVTLTTDIGWAYAAQMKAALYRADAALTVIDLAHDLPRHGIREGSLLLTHMARGFPAGTVHVAVVDPGVGGRRAPIAIECADGSILVGPDNGLLGGLAAELGIRRAVRLDPTRVTPGRRPSATFEGRDLFAPAAGKLARGAPLARLGGAHRPMMLDPPPAARSRGGARGEVLHVDRFGNLITSLPAGWLDELTGPLRLRIDGRRRRYPLARGRTYEELRRGSIALLGSSFGLLEIAVREGSAADRLGVGPGTFFGLERASGERRR